MTDLLMVSHFHKDFPFDHNCSWLKAAYAGSHGPYGWHAPGPGNWINTSMHKSVYESRQYYTMCSEDEFLRALGQQASEYYLWKNGRADYIGCTTYRRYLDFKGDMDQNVIKASLPATQENANYMTSNEQKAAALELLKEYDAITNRLTPMPYSVRNQYLQSQPAEYLNLFLEGIEKLMPDYRDSLNWWEQSEASFETCYVMRKQLFRKYASELFELLEYVWQNTSQPYPTQSSTSEPLPWRYPGFLGERFLPFFLHANQASVARKTLVILE
jgi:hypothetical protein